MEKCGKAMSNRMEMGASMFDQKLVWSFFSVFVVAGCPIFHPAIGRAHPASMGRIITRKSLVQCIRMYIRKSVKLKIDLLKRTKLEKRMRKKPPECLKF